MSLSAVVLLSATLADRGKDPHAAATLATYICRLGHSVAKIRLAECNRTITLKGESLAKKVDLLNDELRTLGLHADDHGAGGLYLTVIAPGKEYSAEKVHITIV